MPRKARSARSRNSSRLSNRAKTERARANHKGPVTLAPSTSLPTTSSFTPLPFTPSQSTPSPRQSSLPSSSSTHATTSAKKLGFSTAKTKKPTIQHNHAFSTTIVHLETLLPLFENLRCAECAGHVTLIQDNTLKGLAVQLDVICMDCGMTCGSSITSRMATQRGPEVNRSLVAASLSVGIGYRQLAKMCEVVGMPSLSVSTFHSIQGNIHRHALTTLDSTCSEARHIVRNLYEPENDGIRNIVVSFDGTWHKRGHTSLHGAAAVICAVTGLIIDTHVMSLHCQLCVTKKGQMDEEDFDQWMEGHEIDCQKNYEGSSGGMEVEAAKILWSRSLEHGLRYTTMIGDGDCKTFNTLTTLAPYGDTQIVKSECVNHVAKRLGTRLRNLVTDEKKKGLTLGGRGEGTLTQEKIGRLQGYYTKAVRGNTSSVPAMRVAIWATFRHCTSTDEEPQHQSCPMGPNSWCFYKRALAHGMQPPSHEGHLSTYMNPTVAKCVERVYQQLTEDDLLSRCLLGKTQNANESFHAQLWLRCPKHIFVSRRRVEIATVLAVGEWNKGSIATHSLMWNMGLEITSLTMKLGQKRDERRLKMAEAASDAVQKKRKLVQREARAREAERQQEDEERGGGPAYMAGGF